MSIIEYFSESEIGKFLGIVANFGGSIGWIYGIFQACTEKKRITREKEQFEARVSDIKKMYEDRLSDKNDEIERLTFQSTRTHSLLDKMIGSSEVTKKTDKIDFPDLRKEKEIEEKEIEEKGGD